jgi:hypothetical protein
MSTDLGGGVLPGGSLLMAVFSNRCISLGMATSKPGTLTSTKQSNSSQLNIVSSPCHNADFKGS